MGARWLCIVDMAMEVAVGPEIDVMKLSRWAAEARVCAEVDEAECRKQNRAGWVAWARHAVKRGGKAAHRWLKGPSNWKPEFAGTADDPKYGPQEIADESLDMWREIWNGDLCEELTASPPPAQTSRGDEYIGRGLCGEEDEVVRKLLAREPWEAEEMAPLELEDVVSALKGFKQCTGVGFCGWHPKVLAQLPEEGLRCVLKLLQTAEAGWVWPESLRNVDMVRIPKESGGHRLIGILPTLYRLWGKFRRLECVKWGTANNDGSDFAVAGQSAQRAAWDFALSNEAVKASGGSTVAWQGDLEKMLRIHSFRVYCRGGHCCKTSSGSYEAGGGHVRGQKENSQRQSIQ